MLQNKLKRLEELMAMKAYSGITSNEVETIYNEVMDYMEPYDFKYVRVSYENLGGDKVVVVHEFVREAIRFLDDLLHKLYCFIFRCKSGGSGSGSSHRAKRSIQEVGKIIEKSADELREIRKSITIDITDYEKKVLKRIFNNFALVNNATINNKNVMDALSELEDIYKFMKQDENGISFDKITKTILDIPRNGMLVFTSLKSVLTYSGKKVNIEKIAPTGEINIEPNMFTDTHETLLSLQRVIRTENMMIEKIILENKLNVDDYMVNDKEKALVVLKALTNAKKLAQKDAELFEALVLEIIPKLKLVVKEKIKIKENR